MSRSFNHTSIAAMRRRSLQSLPWLFATFLLLVMMIDTCRAFRNLAPLPSSSSAYLSSSSHPYASSLQQLHMTPAHIASADEVLSTFAMPNSVILDVRSQPEMDTQGIIQTHGRPWLQTSCTPMECPSLPGAAHVMFPDKNIPIIVHCSSGMRAAKAKEILDQLGYRHVVNAGAYEDLGYLQLAANKAQSIAETGLATTTTTTDVPIHNHNQRNMNLPMEPVFVEMESQPPDTFQNNNNHHQSPEVDDKMREPEQQGTTTTAAATCTEATIVADAAVRDAAVKDAVIMDSNPQQQQQQQQQQEPNFNSNGAHQQQQPEPSTTAASRSWGWGAGDTSAGTTKASTQNGLPLQDQRQVVPPDSPTEQQPGWGWGGAGGGSGSTSSSIGSSTRSEPLVGSEVFFGRRSSPQVQDNNSNGHHQHRHQHQHNQQHQQSHQQHKYDVVAPDNPHERIGGGYSPYEQAPQDDPRVFSNVQQLHTNGRNNGVSSGTRSMDHPVDPNAAFEDSLQPTNYDLVTPPSARDSNMEARRYAPNDPNEFSFEPLEPSIFDNSYQGERDLATPTTTPTAGSRGMNTPDDPDRFFTSSMPRTTATTIRDDWSMSSCGF